jgi:hypothetical protein
MALIGNGLRLSSNPMRMMSQAGVYTAERAAWDRIGNIKNFYLGDAGVSKTSAIPVGYLPPYCWVMPIKAGGMSSTVFVRGAGALGAVNLAGGRNATSAITGDGQLTKADAMLVMWAASAMMANGTIDADLVARILANAGLTGGGNAVGSLVGAVLAVAELVGSGDLTKAEAVMALVGTAGLFGSSATAAGIVGVVQAQGELEGQASLVAEVAGIFWAAAALAGNAQLAALLIALGPPECAITASGSAQGALQAKGNFAAAITSAGEALTTANVAMAVWNALAASMNQPGSMGEKLNSAGAGGDPWNVELPGTYGVGKAGHIVGQNLDDKVSELPVASASATWNALIEAGFTAEDILKIMAAVLAGKCSGGPGSPKFRDLADTKDVVAGDADANGNRTNVEFNP